MSWTKNLERNVYIITYVYIIILYLYKMKINENKLLSIQDMIEIFIFKYMLFFPSF